MSKMVEPDGLKTSPASHQTLAFPCYFTTLKKETSFSTLTDSLAPASQPPHMAVPRISRPRHSRRHDETRFEPALSQIQTHSELSIWGRKKYVWEREEIRLLHLWMKKVSKNSICNFPKENMVWVQNYALIFWFHGGLILMGKKKSHVCKTSSKIYFFVPR